jgi:hypothetical protein
LSFLRQKLVCEITRETSLSRIAYPALKTCNALKYVVNKNSLLAGTASPSGWNHEHHFEHFQNRLKTFWKLLEIRRKSYNIA